MRRSVCGLAVIALATALVACGDSGASQEELNEARKQGIAKERQRQKLTTAARSHPELAYLNVACRRVK